MRSACVQGWGVGWGFITDLHFKFSVLHILFLFASAVSKPAFELTHIINLPLIYLRRRPLALINGDLKSLRVNSLLRSR